MRKMIQVTTTEGKVHFVTTGEKVIEMLNLLKEFAHPNAEIKVFDLNKMPLEKLPENTQDKVKEILKAYNKCNVVYQKGHFEIHVGTYLSKHYAFDYFTCGTYTAEEVYTEEERKQNYKEI